jgi:hypothetical protein
MTKQTVCDTWEWWDGTAIDDDDDDKDDVWQGDDNDEDDGESVHKAHTHSCRTHAPPQSLIHTQFLRASGQATLSDNIVIDYDSTAHKRVPTAVCAALHW